MKLIWYTSILLTILLILTNNPKSQGFGSIGNQSQLFSYTRSTQKNILILTTITSSIFVLLTIILTSNITE